jgi:hypothetical protein
MAPCYPFETQQASFPYSVLLDCLIGVFAAGGEKAAPLISFYKRKETMIKRQGFLIETYEF